MSIKFWEGPSEINGAPIMGYIAGSITRPAIRRRGLPCRLALCCEASTHGRPYPPEMT